MNTRPIEILLVEDNPGDARLAQEAMKDAKVKNNLHWVEDGVQALSFLRNEKEYEQAPRPDVVLLDLNLPKKDGREVLSEIKSDDQLKNIPVVILTVSSDEADILKSYNLHANCYITKPLDLDSFIEVVKSIEASQSMRHGTFVLRGKIPGAFSPALGGISVQRRLWPQTPSLIKNETEQEGNHSGLPLRGGPRYHL
jgi:CheY-like chemotaxis protein